MIIIDNGLGNLASIFNMLRQIGLSPEVTNDYDKISKSMDIILPGVGNFKKGIENLKEKNIHTAILNAANNKSRILGICLGMHFLFDKSDEGNEKGLGLIEGKVIKFSLKNENYKVPHMGWNFVNFKINSDFCFKYKDRTKFYFAHSYYADCKNKKNIVGETNYCIEFPSAVQKENIYGVQFHPEKSHNFGKEFFKNFYMKNDN
tara:strand:- start:577 stop:1188 length:612 start_codon:yes stop_codon:yes gene_type:complete